MPVSVIDDLREIFDTLNIAYSEQKLQVAARQLRDKDFNKQALMDKLQLSDRKLSVGKIVDIISQYEPPLGDCFICTPAHSKEPNRTIPVLDTYKYKNRMEHLAAHNPGQLKNPYDYFIAIPKKYIPCPKCSGNYNSLRDTVQYFSRDEYALTWMILFDYCNHQLNMNLKPNRFNTVELFNHSIQPALNDWQQDLFLQLYPELPEISVVGELQPQQQGAQSECPF